MEQRQYGEMTTLETRHDAHQSVDKKKRYAQIKECLIEAQEKCKIEKGHASYHFLIPFYRDPKGYQGTFQKGIAIIRKIFSLRGYGEIVISMRLGELSVELHVV